MSAVVDDVAVGDDVGPEPSQQAREIRVSWGEHKLSTSWKLLKPMTFRRLIEWFGEAKPATKPKDNLPAWSAGHVVGPRTYDNATGADALVVEYDQHEFGPKDPVTGKRPKILLPDERRTSMADALARWEGVERGLVTSYSHTPEIPRFRVALSYSRRVTKDEHDRIIHWAFDKLEKAGDSIDEQCAEIHRLWFAPCIPPSGHFYHQYVEGKPLDVDALLKSLPAPAAKKAEGYSADTRLGERIEQIKAKVDFETVLREAGVPFESKGTKRVYNLRNERTPSAVYYDDGHIYDFGSSEVWDVISFYQARQAGGVFKSTIDALSERAKLPPFPWKLASRPRKADPLPVIEALPDDLPLTGRLAVLHPALQAILTQDAIDQKPFVDALLAKYAATDAKPKQLTRKEVEAALRELDTPEDDAPEKGEGTYEVRGGSLYYVVTVGGVPLPTALVSGNIEITEAVKYDDGAETKEFFRIRATTASGTVLPEIELPMTEFDQMYWVTPKTGGRLNVEKGRSIRDTLRHAILARSVFPQTTTYGDFGWRKIDGKEVFVHAGGAIGSETPIRVEAPSAKLKRFDLSLPEKRKHDSASPSVKLKAAIHDSLHFLKVAKPSITHPLYASIWHAPVIDVLPHRSALTIIGQTGALKSSLALEAQRHYGGGFTTIRDFVANFESTAAAMEIIGHSLHNMLLVVDDAWPKTGKDGEKQKDLCRKMIHTYANNAPRERATTDIKLRASREIRSVLWMTAECDLASASDGASTANRALKIKIEKGDVDQTKLAHLQRADHPHFVMRSYVEWLSQNTLWRIELPQKHKEEVKALRALVNSGSLQARQPEVLASLIVSMSTFLDFCVSVDALFQEDADKHLAETRRALIEIASEQTEISKATSPVQRYLRVLKGALNTGKARLRLPEEKLASVPGCADVGWAEASEKHVRLHPEALHALLVQGDSEKAGVNSLSDVFAMMVTELGATPPTASEKGRTGVKRAVGGVKVRVIEIPIEHFDDVAILSRESAPSVDDSGPDSATVAQLRLVV